MAIDKGKFIEIIVNQYACSEELAAHMADYFSSPQREHFLDFIGAFDVEMDLDIIEMKEK